MSGFADRMVDMIRRFWFRQAVIPMPLSNSRIFVTGVYGSGKTYFAKHVAAKSGLPFVSFDDRFDYTSKENQSHILLSGLPSSFIMDAIPIDERASWNDFRSFEAEHEVAVVCVYCPDMVKWLKRVMSKNDALRLDSALPRKLVKRARRVLRDLKRSFGPAGRGALTLRDEQERVHLRAYRAFYANNLATLRTFSHVAFYDSLRNEFTSEETMLQRLHVDTFPLHDRLDVMASAYDVAYQDIEVLNAVGYSESYKTWKSIRDVVAWKDQRVVDLGCFHGYFCFKIEDRGGKVRGLDRSVEALETARMINTLRDGRVVFEQWVGGDPIPECDMILCLNMLHHVGTTEVQERTVAGMRCRSAVFEVNRDQLPMIERHFQTVKLYRSHRANRVVVVAIGPHHNASHGVAVADVSFARGPVDVRGCAGTVTS